jgi:hypothetical protein
MLTTPAANPSNMSAQQQPRQEPVAVADSERLAHPPPEVPEQLSGRAAALTQARILQARELEGSRESQHPSGDEPRSLVEPS